MENEFNNLPKDRQKQLLAFDRLLTIMDDLREKCPWDKKQTMDTLRHLTIEETYELSDAILENDPKEVMKELGDVLLHIVFYAKIGSEPKPDGAFQFDIEDVLNNISEKLIFRHPHIYSDTIAEDEAAVKQNWEKLKLKEGNKSVLSGVPSSLPALVKAMRIQEKARGAGFDWDEKAQVWEKVEEELQEFRDHFKIEDNKAINQSEAEGEFGDLLFSLVNYSRFVDINPETALERTNKKFIRRFQYMEEASKKEGKVLTNMTLDEMDTYWNKAKALGI